MTNYHMPDEPNGKPRILTVENGGAEPHEDELEAAVKADPSLQMGIRAMKRNVSRGEAVKFITTAAMAMGEKVYQQISAEHARVFAEMEKRLSDRIAVLESKLEIANAGHESDDGRVESGHAPLRLEDGPESHEPEASGGDRAL